MRSHRFAAPPHGHGYVLDLADGDTLAAGAVVLATPAYVTGALVASLDTQLAEAHAEIPYASTAIVTLAYPSDVLSRPLDGYGYVVPRIEGSDVLACTWTSSKWPGRAPEAHALVRVYMGRFGRRDVTVDSDEELVALARREIAATLAPNAGPAIVRVHRWPRGMPQYVMGSLERLALIERRLEEHPALALAGAAYRGVGIPDCIASGEQAAETVLAGRARAGACELSALRIGTRSSRLAMAQAHMAAAALRELGHEVAIVPLSTQGDRDARRTFAEIGGRGIFASELEEALCDGRIDVAVHSAKDLTGEDVDGLSLAACLERADPRDAWVGPARSWDEVPRGSARCNGVDPACLATPAHPARPADRARPRQRRNAPQETRGTRARCRHPGCRRPRPSRSRRPDRLSHRARRDAARIRPGDRRASGPRG